MKIYPTQSNVQKEEKKINFSDKTKHQLLLHNTEAGLQIYQLVSA